MKKIDRFRLWVRWKRLLFYKWRVDRYTAKVLKRCEKMESGE